jgi:hypothetical protein
MFSRGRFNYNIIKDNEKKFIMSNQIGISQQIILFVSISLILAVISVLSLGFTMIMTSASYGKTGKQGPKGDIGQTGVCNLSNSDQVFVAGKIELNNSLLINGSSYINFTNNGSIYSDSECLKITSSNSVCFDTPSIKSSNNNSLYIESILCFDEDCTVGIMLANNNNSKSLSFFGPTNIQSLSIPLFIGKIGGILDELPETGLLISSNPNSTGGIRFNSQGNGIKGNETFIDIIGFNNPISIPGVKLIGQLLNVLMNIYHQNNNIIINLNTSNFTIFESVQSGLIFSTPTFIKLLSDIVEINCDKINLKNAYIYLSNISFDLSSNSNQIGFYNNRTNNSINGWIRSNSSCPIVLGPSFCSENGIIKDFYVTNINIENNGKITSNSVINFTGNVFIQNLSIQTISILGFTNFPNGISSSGLLISSGPSLISGGLQTDFLSVANTFTTKDLFVSGKSTFINNVTFNSPNAICNTPIFTNTGDRPCVTPCLSFYTCHNISAINFRGRNGLEVASNLTDFDTNSPSEINFGFGIDIVNKLYSETLKSYTLTSNVSKTKTGDLFEVLSFGDINMFSSKKTTFYNINLQNISYSPLNCIPPITLTLNNSGVLTNLILSSPYFNYSNNSCIETTENYLFSNMSIIKEGETIFGSVQITRYCSGICTPYLGLNSKEFPFDTLIKSSEKQITIFNNSLSTEYQELLLYAIRNLTLIYPQATITSKLSLYYINTAITTQNDTYKINNYAYIVTNGKKGELDINSSKTINLGKISVSSLLGDIVIPGTILDNSGDLHPCCGGDASTSKTSKMSLTSSITINILNSSQSIISVSFGSSFSVSGTLGGWNSTTLAFKAQSKGIYKIEATFLVSALTNISTIGCVYDVKDSNNLHQYYKFSQKYNSVTDLPDDGIYKYVECNHFEAVLATNESVDADLYTTSALNQPQTSDRSISIQSSSYVIAIKQ